MAGPDNLRRRFRRFEYDPVTGKYVLAAVVLAALALGALAFSFQGSPRMDDVAAARQGATIPNPNQLSPAPVPASPPGAAQ
jgi:hypothetical protein